MATKVFDDKLAIDSAFSRLHDRDDWIDGVVVTKHHIVTVYYEAGQNPFARFDLVSGGKLHMRNINGRKFTKRGLSIMAGKFSKEFAHD